MSKSRQRLAFLVIAMLLGLVGAMPAAAVNWEGHTDWMVDMPAALELEAAAGRSGAPASHACETCSTPQAGAGECAPDAEAVAEAASGDDKTRACNP